KHHPVMNEKTIERRVFISVSNDLPTLISPLNRQIASKRVLSTAADFGEGGDGGVDVVLGGEVARAEAEGAAGRGAEGGVHAGGAVEAGAGLNAPVGVKDGGELLRIVAGDVQADDADAIRA